MKLSNTVKIMGAWKRFQAGHPKFPAFLAAVKREGVREGTVIELSVTTPEGKNIVSNLKLTAEDLELFRSLGELEKE